MTHDGWGHSLVRQCAWRGGGIAWARDRECGSVGSVARVASTAACLCNVGNAAHAIVTPTSAKAGSCVIQYVILTLCTHHRSLFLDNMACYVRCSRIDPPVLPINFILPGAKDEAQVTVASCWASARSSIMLQLSV